MAPASVKNARHNSSINEAEIAHFTKDSKLWWDEKGPFRPLHRLNPVRIAYIRDRVAGHFGLDKSNLKPLKGISILDIGCGGGLACEPLARLGATVTGIDADTQAIDVAKEHAKGGGLSIAYKNGAAEDLLHCHPERSEGSPSSAKGNKREILRSAQDDSKREDDSTGPFDVVMALEVIEHVAEPDQFVKTCASLCRPGGIVIFSTLNRTPRSFALGIVAAEYILGWVARGTHDWRKFIRPSELSASARRAGLNAVDVTGLVLNPLKNEFVLSKTDLAVNYFMTTEKK